MLGVFLKVHLSAQKIESFSSPLRSTHTIYIFIDRERCHMIFPWAPRVYSQWVEFKMQPLYLLPWVSPFYCCALRIAWWFTPCQSPPRKGPCRTPRSICVYESLHLSSLMTRKDNCPRLNPWAPLCDRGDTAFLPSTGCAWVWEESLSKPRENMSRIWCSCSAHHASIKKRTVFLLNHTPFFYIKGWFWFITLEDSRFPPGLCLVVALGNQQQRSLPLTGKEVGTGIEQILILRPSLWGLQWYAGQQAKPEQTWYGTESSGEMEADWEKPLICQKQSPGEGSLF